MLFNIKTISLLWLSIVISLAACNKEIEFDDEEIERLLVVNNIVEPGQAFHVYVEHSRFFLDTEADSRAINNATVTIKDQSTGTMETVTAGTDGYYSFSLVAQLGHRYSLNVSHPDYPAVSSEMTVPPVIPILSVDTSSVVSSDFFGNSQTDITWNDPLGSNFYMVIVREYGTGNYTNMHLSSNDISITNGYQNEQNDSKNGYYFTLSDTHFNGSQKSLSLSHFSSQFAADSVEIHLYHVTEDVYKYTLSAELEQSSSDDIFTEPVYVHNNIENGIGIFGAVSASKFTLYY